MESVEGLVHRGSINVGAVIEVSSASAVECRPVEEGELLHGGEPGGTHGGEDVKEPSVQKHLIPRLLIQSSSTGGPRVKKL